MKLAISVFVAVLVIGLGLAAFAAAGRNDTAADDGSDETQTQQEPFVGLALDAAIEQAEAEGRPWRIAREDDTVFVLTDDLQPGRVTFEIDEGNVSDADIEQPNTDPPVTDDVPEDPARSALIAAAVLRLSTADNGFNDPAVFDDIRVASVLGSDRSPLAPLDLELIAASLSDLGQVRFIDDAAAEINSLFAESPSGVAVVAVERVELLDDRAEVEMSLWCGSLCAVFLTYEAEPQGDGWEIIGTVGPIAMS